jgi:hypothetical protein
MQLQHTGTIIVLNETRQVTDSFSLREFVIEDDGQYKQAVQFQCSQSKCDLLDSFQTGDMVTVSFNLRGKAWNDPKTGNDRYFNTLDAWKIEAVEVLGSNPPPPTTIIEDLEEDSLPF